MPPGSPRHRTVALRADRRGAPRAWPWSAPRRGRGWRPRRSARSPPITRRSRPTSTRSPATSSRAGWRWSWRRSPTCATARTRTSAPRSTGDHHRSGTLADATRLQGERPSFNNLLDLDAAYRIARDYTAPTVAIVKHTDPVGLASHDELVEAYRHALETDPVASFGGIVGVNRELDGATAREIAANSYEAVVAPGFSQSALGILRGKTGLELLAVPPDPTEGMRDYGIASLDFKRVAGGLLVETQDELGLDRGRLQVVTKRRPTLEELTDLLFAWRAVRHVRSNAIVLARNGATVGIGAAQASRQVSVEIALRRAGDRARLSVMASDAYFPFPDGIQAAAGGRRHRDHPARRLDPRRDGDRGRRPPPPGDGLHRADPPLSRPPRVAPAPGGCDGTAARARDGPGHRRRRRSRPRGPWVGATATARTSSRPRRCAGRWTRSTSPGRIVIGEGERDEAPMLYIGEEVGRRDRGRANVPAVDIAVDPLEGTNLVAHGQAGAITVLAASEAGGLTHAPDTYMEKLCVGPVVAGKVDIRETPTENLRRIAGALGRASATSRSSSSSGPVTRRSSPRSAPPVRASSSSATATCRRPSRPPCRAPASTPSWASAARRRASSRRPRCAASAARSRRVPLSQRRGTGAAARGWATATRSRVYHTEDLAPGENLVFAATGVTAGDLLQGVRFFGGGARTHSLVMAYQTKQVRFVDTVHMFDRDSPPRVRL